MLLRPVRIHAPNTRDQVAMQLPARETWKRQETWDIQEERQKDLRQKIGEEKWAKQKELTRNKPKISRAFMTNKSPCQDLGTGW